MVVFLLATREYRYNKYTNSSAGFGMKYPAKWSREENKNGAVVIFSSPKENELDTFRENVNIVRQFVDPKINLQKYTDMAIDQLRAVFKQNVEILESTPTYIGDSPAYKIVYIGKGDLEVKLMHVWTLKGGYAYQFTYTSLSTRFNEYWPKVEAMLNSFTIY